jgi:3-oxoadipate enol-lactonase
VRLFSLRRGSGEPLLLIQGMSGHHRMWGEPFLSLLERDFDVLVFDHRGIGTSERADEPFTTADLAADAAEMITGAGWASAHVLGISLGGMVAQELALRHPELVRTLILGCTYAGPSAGTLSGPGAERIPSAMATRDPEVVTRVAFEINVAPARYDMPGEFERFRDATRSVKVPAPVVRLQFQALAAHDAVDRLPSLTVPTMVVHGTEDQLLTYTNAEHIARLVPDARLVLLDGVGHVFWWERPELSAELVREHALGR